MDAKEILALNTGITMSRPKALMSTFLVIDCKMLDRITCLQFNQLESHSASNSSSTMITNTRRQRRSSDTMLSTIILIRRAAMTLVMTSQTLSSAKSLTLRPRATGCSQNTMTTSNSKCKLDTTQLMDLTWCRPTMISGNS